MSDKKKLVVVVKMDLTMSVPRWLGMWPMVVSIPGWGVMMFLVSSGVDWERKSATIVSTWDALARPAKTLSLSAASYFCRYRLQYHSILNFPVVCLAACEACESC